ncbi:hypothetical protein QVD17_36418 [Tagetes erecta]|uniref:Uncharacterized protein n=1 Tax=Tagetes erecta TaxID=13708 RepID=A0AAD8JUV8_TARER|nr:hypothetical protein QVD17_36418 [Tagetes erecta]
MTKSRWRIGDHQRVMGDWDNKKVLVSRWCFPRVLSWYTSMPFDYPREILKRDWSFEPVDIIDSNLKGIFKITLVKVVVA